MPAIDEGATADHVNADSTVGITRRDALKAGGAGLAFLATPALLAACGGESGDAAAERIRGPIISGQSFAPTTLDPHTASEIGALSMIVAVYEGLYAKSPKEPYDIVAQLADGEPEAVSGTQQRIKLRSGAKFHDGTPVTAADVEASFDRLLNPDTASLYAGFLTMIKSVRAAGSDTVEIELKFPTTFLKDRLALVHIAPAAVLRKKNPIKVFNTKPIGSGPYQVESISGNLRSIRMTKSTQYNGPFEVALAESGWDTILDDQARIAALQTKRLRAAVDPPFNALERLDQDPQLAAKGTPSFQQSLLIYNCKKKPFSDPRVRQAILHAIDRDVITKSVFFDHARPAVSYLPEDHPDFKEPATSLAYDPERARALLAEAGVPRLQFRMNLSNLGWLAPQGALIQSQLKDVGIDITIRQGEVQSLVKYVLDGSFDAWLTVTDPSVFGNSDGEFLIRWIYFNLAAGFLYWTTPAATKMAKLLDQALGSDSRDEVKELVGEMQDIIAAEVPAFPLHHREAIASWSTGLDLTVDPVYGIDLRQVKLAR